jgi:hypothetical protein
MIWGSLDAGFIDATTPSEFDSVRRDGVILRLDV